MINNIIQTIVGLTLLFTPAYLLIRYIYIKVNKKNAKVIKEIICYIFYLYTFILIKTTILPHIAIYFSPLEMYFMYPFVDFGIEPVTGVFFELTGNGRSINLVPFNGLIDYLKIVGSGTETAQLATINIFGNILLFVPFGLFVPMVTLKKSLKELLILSTTCIVSIECFQFLVGRTSDINDLILNTIGVVIGYMLYRVIWGRIIKF